MHRSVALFLGLALIAACHKKSEPAAEPSDGTRPDSPGVPQAATDPKTEPESMAPPPPTDPSTLSSLARSHNALGIELWRQAPKNVNLSVSPASIGMALGMTYLGARGETAAQMKKVLHLELDPKSLEVAHANLLATWKDANAETTEIAVANRIFVDKTLDVVPEFLRATRDGFAAPAETKDFKNAAEPTRAAINEWVVERTRDKIKDLLPPGSIVADTRMVLVNALYFKAKWQEPFQKERTVDGTFYAAGSKKTSVPMMKKVESFPYREVGEVSIATLAYESGPFEFSIVLPKQRDGLAAVEKALSVATLDAWFGGEPRWERLALELPRFTVKAPDESLQLKEALIALGMPLAFDRDQADFTGIHAFQSPADRLLISEVFHKAFVAVDEAGTEAAAATAVTMMRAGGMPAEPKPFVVDHPFLFVIRDKNTGMLLFIGRVIDPAQ